MAPTMAGNESGLSLANEAVLSHSEPLPENSVIVKGFDFSDGVDYDALLGSYIKSGFQATNFGRGVEIVKKMVRLLSGKCFKG